MILYLYNIMLGTIVILNKRNSINLYIILRLYVYIYIMLS